MKSFIGMMIFIAGLGLLVATEMKHYNDGFLFLSAGAMFAGLDMFVDSKIKEAMKEITKE